MKVSEKEEKKSFVSEETKKYMNEKFLKCCPCLNFKKDSSLVEIFEMQLRFWFMSLSIEIFVIYLISILVTELNATTDTSM